METTFRSLLPELVSHIFTFLVEENIRSSNAQGLTLASVCRTWHDSVAVVPGFWRYTVGSALPDDKGKRVWTEVKVNWFERYLWTNQVVLGVPVPRDSHIRSLDVCWTQNWMIERLKCDKNLMHLGVFERVDNPETPETPETTEIERPEAEECGEEGCDHHHHHPHQPHYKFERVKLVCLGEYLGEWDGEEWQRLFMHFDLKEPVGVKQGQYLGLCYEDKEHGFTPEEQSFWPHIPNLRDEGVEEEWPVCYDRNCETNEMEGPEMMTSTGWRVILSSTIATGQTN